MRIFRYLNSCGYTVITADLCGHGSSVPKENLGFFNEKNGYQILLQDVMIVRNYIRKHYPDKPVYLFAHSMGTIISRVVLQKHSADYDKVVLSGYPNCRHFPVFGSVCCSRSKVQIKTFTVSECRKL